MIAYVFLSLGMLGTAGVAYSVAPAARGVHRYVVPRSQLRHELCVAQHELAGAGEYIARLERDRRELSGLLEKASTERADLKAALVKAGLRIAELEEQLRDADQLRETNTALKADLANAHAMRSLPPHGDTPRPATRPVPLHQAPFAISPVTPS